MIGDVNVRRDDEIGFFVFLREIDVVVVAEVDAATDIHQDRTYFQIVRGIEILVAVQPPATGNRGADSFLRLNNYTRKNNKKENKPFSQRCLKLGTSEFMLWS